MAVSEQAEAMRWTGVTEMAARVRAGEWSPTDTVRAAFERIDAAEPQLNAFQRLRREAALAEADEVARRLAAGEFLPLAGVPIAAKDDTPIAGEVMTKASRARTQVEPTTAEHLELIRRAGGILVGATRTPEFCLVPFTESDLGGITRNPWGLDRTPGGSSGGSAAAVAAGLVPAALGGDGGGSIRVPAAWCGLPGLYATPGSISDAPYGPGWTGITSYGALARTIADTALLYDVLFIKQQGFTAAIGEPAPRIRIARSDDRAADRPIPQGGPIAKAWTQAADDTAATLARAGHEVTHGVRMRFGQAPLKFAVRYLTSVRDEARATDDPERIEAETARLVKLGRYTRPLMNWALDTRAERAAVEASLEGYEVLITPSAPQSAPPAGEREGDRPLATSLRAARRVSFLNTWNLLGWPGISVPSGIDADGLPLSTLLVARPGSERLLLQLAAELEAARPWPLGHGVGEASQPQPQGAEAT